ncbi:MAG: hypothetical protein RL708_1731 [Bacteroidota bacterium]|jgi:cytochrome c-type biogenesis protein CcmF
MNTVFEGEHLLPGQLGHLGVITIFIASLISAIAYFISTNKKDEAEQNSFLKVGRWAFVAMAVGVLTTFFSLFFIIYNHYFEYHYAWRHSSLELPVHYMISCFWEGQEGSFLLWMFWQMMLGLVLIRTAKKWEAPVVSVIAFSQFFLASMLLGIYVFDFKIGSNPFTLLRDVMSNAPIFKRGNYLSMITDGNGLNPLLQNYWMVIHPPVLFLGFASTVVPFAYAIAGWWKNDFDGWTKAVWPWALFSGVALSTGIMMGAAWAYEALSFGGYWAWDPVENASIMPWLTLIAGIHTLLAYRHSDHAQKATYVLLGLSFLLVLYASFLTRSGILGESSVHAFTDLGLGGQLVFNIIAFIIPFIFLFIFRFKNVQEPGKEEKVESREFWMFIGALVFLVSLFQITFTTSIPVFNKLLGTNWAPPTNAIQHYNKIQVWIAILIGLLVSFTQYLRYKSSDVKSFLKEIAINSIVASIIAGFCIWYFEISVIAYWFMMLAAIFAIIFNLKYLYKLKKNFINWGGSIAHVGFGLMLVGILISSYKQKVITSNSPTSGLMGKGFDETMKRENMLLMKNTTEKLQGYEITYVGDSTSAPNTYYKVQYVKRNADSSIAERFFLYPNIQENKKMGSVNNPSTRHYFTKDIYTIVTATADKKKADAPVNQKDYKFYKLKKGDTINLKGTKIIFQSISNEVLRKDVVVQSGDVAASIRCKVYNANNSFNTESVYLIRNSMAVPIEDKVNELGIRIFVNQIIPTENSIELGIAETEPVVDYITLKALEFPYINLLWIGTIVVILGFLISIFKRIKLK